MKIKELKLNTSDVAAAAKFYNNCLQLPIISRSAEKVSFAVGYSILSFISSPAPKPFYHFAFNIPAKLLEQALSWTNARVSILPFSESSVVAEFKNWQAKAFYFHDHEGNIVEFIARFELPSAQEEQAFDQTAIMGISEIGLAVDDVLAESKRLSHSLQLPYFAKGPSLDDFTALGSDEALILLTKEGRGWLPTGRPAEKHKVAVRLQAGSQLLELCLTESGAAVKRIAITV